MAGELTVNSSLSVKKGVIVAAISGTYKRDVAGSHYIQQIQTIGASEESVSKLDIGTLGYCVFKNVGETGVISVGGVTGAYTIKLNPGETAGPIMWSTNAIYALGDTAGCLLEMLLIEL